MFSIVMLLLYWIQNLVGAHWGWLGFIIPFLKFILDAARHIFDKSITFGGATFEFKYLIAVAILCVIYYMLFLVKRMVSMAEELYCNGRKQVRKMQEVAFNANLEHSVQKMQKKNDRYQIYVATQLKKNILYNGSGISLSDENKSMNKYLIEKTGVVPAVIRNGFVYSFSNFEQIDVVLEKFFKLLKAQTPLDYYICVYLADGHTGKNQYNLEKLADLGIKNKIITLADLVLRYNYNSTKKYDISVVGVFQKGDESFEVHQFVERNET